VLLLLINQVFAYNYDYVSSSEEDFIFPAGDAQQATSKLSPYFDSMYKYNRRELDEHERMVDLMKSIWKMDWNLIMSKRRFDEQSYSSSK